MKCLALMVLPVFLPVTGFGQMSGDFEGANPTGAHVEAGAVEVSPARAKSGGQSLKWSWDSARSSLTLQNPDLVAKASGKSGFVFWAWQGTPRRQRMDFELLHQGNVVGHGWFWMDFKGWRILGAANRQVGVAANQAVDAVRLHAPSGNGGELWIDMLRVGPDFTASRTIQMPWVDQENGLERCDAVTISADDPSMNRPWIPAQRGEITPGEEADMQRLEKAFLSAKTIPGKGLPQERLVSLRKTMESLAIRRVAGGVNGTAVDGGSPLKPNAFTPYGDVLKACDSVRVAYYQASDPGQEQELKRMFLDLTEYLLDQGWAPGYRLAGFDNYPFREYPCFFAMYDVLKESGLARPVAQALMDHYGSHSPGDFTSQNPGSTMDGLGFWNRELFACALMFPTSKERLQHLLAAKRFLDLALVNPVTIAPDGSCYHHGGFHFAYASYNLPRLLQVLERVSSTRFRIGPEAHERLKTYVRSLAFTSSAGEQAYNLCMRAGTPLHTDGIEPVARMLANIGTPDGREPVDAEMASVSLRLLAERKPGATPKEFQQKPWKDWLDRGIRPATAPEGFLVMNGAPIAVCRRDGWVANIAGINPFYRGIEIYGWTQSNNYGRFARNGSMVITSQGNPPNLKESGWSLDGWNWCHFPGTTALKVAKEVDIFDGYAMYGNGNPNVGGTSMDGDGVWGMDFSGHALLFRKSYFCFENRITSVTTGIRAKDARNSNPVVTTLFQNSMDPGSGRVMIDGMRMEDFPGEKTISFEKQHWLMDNKGTGYLVPSGNNPIHLACKRQTWRYMTEKHLVDPARNPISGEVKYQNVRGRIKDLSSIEDHYKPSEGDFATAWFDHGSSPESGTCVYTAVVRTSPEHMAELARNPVGELLQSDANAHVLHDRGSDTVAYVVYQAGATLDGRGPVRSCSEPCSLMLRRKGSVLSVSLAYTCAGNSVPAGRKVGVRLRIRGAWKPTGGGNLPEASVDGDETVIVILPKDNIPIRFKLQESS